MRKLWILAFFALAACTERSLTTAPTPVAGPTPVVPPPPLPTNVPGVLALAMPLDPSDAASTLFGMMPFGYHVADLHAQDGHAGWDIEFRAGGIVRAAAAGTIQDVTADSLGRFTIQIEHVVGQHFYRTIYSNLATVTPAVAPDAVVVLGQPIGLAATFIHFQLDDLEFHREIVNPKAVSPEPFLTPAALPVFNALWTRAAFAPELIEPFPTNPREVVPQSRTWTRAGGDGAPGIRFTRSSTRAGDYTYELLAESGTVVETGRVVLDVSARPYPAIDLVSTTSPRLGVYDIVSNELRLSLGSAGTSRPSDLSAATIYRTTP